MGPFLIVLLASGTLWPQETVFQAGVSLVKVDAQVSDRRGRLISDLTKQDFAVFDENQPQTITYFEREREPLDLPSRAV